MAENADQSDVVPPSPIATSTQLSQSGARLPQLPTLDLDLNIEGIPDIEPVSRSPTLSPIATLYAGQGERRLRRFAGDRDQRSSSSRLQDLIREQGESSREASQLLQDIIDVDDDADSRTSSMNSDVISIGHGSSDIEHVSDSGSGSTIADDDDDDSDLDRPANPVPGHAPPDVPETVTSDSETEGSHPLNLPAASDIIPRDASTSVPPATPWTLGPTATSPTPGPSSAPTVPAVQILGAHGRSPADFRSPKRKRVHSPEKSSACVDKPAENEEDDCCPICFEAWTTSGLHRLCSLKCGHLFGQSCIEKWLKGQGGKCPHCNTKAKRQDIRVLYAKSIKALETSERDRALKDLEKEREGKRKAEMEGAQLRLQYQMAIEENNSLKLQVQTLQYRIRNAMASALPGISTLAKLDVTPRLNQSQIAGRFLPDKTIKIWEAGNCRVMAYCPTLATLVVSQPSSSPLFPGFGVKKICTLDFKTSQYLTIHSKAIRDVALHPSVEDGMLLSCGLDKKIKMTSLLSNTVVQSYEASMPVWSCVWNAEDSNYFYAGLQNGLVLEYDIRNTEGSVREFNKAGSRSPVASLCFIPNDIRADFRSGGLLIGQLDRVSFYENLPGNQSRLHILPLEGSLTSLRIEPNTRHILASYRPTARHPTIRHQLCEMITRNISADPTTINNVCSCNVIHTFHGGRTQTVLSKSLVLQHPADANRLLVCAGDETKHSVRLVHVWDSGTGQLLQRLQTDGVIVDMCSFRINNTTYLSALSDTQCKVYRWT